jgi:hypothetical protein
MRFSIRMVLRYSRIERTLPLRRKNKALDKFTKRIA